VNTIFRKKNSETHSEFYPRKGPRKALVKTGGEKPAKSVENQINAPIPVGLPVPLLGRTQHCAGTGMFAVMQSKPFPVKSQF
jgi:hypothetical protein